MKITAIKKQVKNPNRYSIFIDSKYGFSLSDLALIDTKLAVGDELTDQDLAGYKNRADEDKLYNNCLNYIARRMRSKWEIESYLGRKKASPTLVKDIVNKLSIKGLIDDQQFANRFVADRHLLKPTSKRKLMLELRSKKISEDIINNVLKDDQDTETDNLKRVIASKRRQTKYRDNTKLMQYLAGQGFNYGDIKSALNEPIDD